MKSTLSSPQPVHIVYDDDLSNAKRATGAVCLTDVMPHDVAWLWLGRIPLGNVTLLVSDPGVGKSLVALDIAARVSTGRPWPDEAKAEGGVRKAEGNPADTAPSSDLPPSPFHTPPSSVLLINIEDHFHNTIRPRLDALGADCSRIMAWTYVSGELLVEVPHLFALTRDLDRLATLVSAMQDYRLVILDPITAFLGDSSDQCSADVWKLLSALASLTRKRNFAVLAVSHLRKKEGAAIHRALGSLAFVAAARAVWTVAKDAADPKKRLLLPLKNNLAPDTGGLAFTIETHEPTHAAAIRWLPAPVSFSADTIIGSARCNGRPDNERQSAIRWLQNQLSGSPRATRDIKQAADAHGICQRTLRRAFRELGGEAIRQGPFPTGQWLWKLPDVDGQNPRGEFWTPTQFAGEFAELAIK